MSRAARLLVIVAAWAVPVAWVTLALLSGPSDGTTVSPTTGLSGTARWGETVTVVRTYGDSSLRPGDRVLTIDGRSMREWVTSTRPASARASATAWSTRCAAAARRRLSLSTSRSTCASPPIRCAPRSRPTRASLVLCGLGLAVASLVFWRAPTSTSARAWLVAAALVPAVLTSSPFGLGAVDLAGGRGAWPHLVGELVAAVGVAAAVAVAVALTAPPTRPRWGWAVLAAPLVGYAVWALLVVGRDDPAARLQGAAHDRRAGRAGCRRGCRRRAAGGVPPQRGAHRPPRHPARPPGPGRRAGAPAAARRPARAPGRAGAGAVARAHRGRGARRDGVRGGRRAALPPRRDRAARTPRPRPGPRRGRWSAARSWPAWARSTGPRTATSSRCSRVASSRCWCSPSRCSCSGPCNAWCTATATCPAASSPTCGGSIPPAHPRSRWPRA